MRELNFARRANAEGCDPVFSDTTVECMASRFVDVTDKWADSYGPLERWATDVADRALHEVGGFGDYDCAIRHRDCAVVSGGNCRGELWARLYSAALAIVRKREGLCGGCGANFHRASGECVACGYRA